MPIVALAIVGLLGIVGGFVASRVGRSRSAADPSSAFTRWWRIARWIGLALAVASWPLTGFMAYPYAGANGRPGHVAGIPFMAAYFDDQGRDYVGTQTMVAVLANAVFWYLFPRLVVVVTDTVRQRRQRARATAN
ncbi:MAG: hypothetical protein HS104_16350 [Polyangiaceae bacterium]|nr:hypothetical protein [Polyangiaceae bacterium]